MLRNLPALALILAPLAVQAQATPLSLEHRMLLRCAATAAMVAHGQETGNAAMASYPDMRERGREFFIRASVQVMDEAGVSRELVEQELRSEARNIVREDTVHQMVPICLPLIPQEQ